MNQATRIKVIRDFLFIDKGADRVDYQGTEETHGPVSSGGRYDDFETIDWVKDIARDRCRHRDLHSKRVCGFLLILPCFASVRLVIGRITTDYQTALLEAKDM